MIKKDKILREYLQNALYISKFDTHQLNIYMKPRIKHLNYEYKQQEKNLIFVKIGHASMMVMFYLRILIQYSINLVEMFQNSYQNGSFFELFDPKMSQDKLKTLYRSVNVNGSNKVFDKQLKTFVMEFTTPSAKLILPKQQKRDLYLIQQYLNLQIYFFPGLSWNIELVVSDLTKTKRRVVLSPAATKTEVKPFFVKSQCNGYKEGCWNNFIVDLYSFIEAFKGQTYRSLDSIYISGHFKLKRVFTSSTIPFDTNEEGYQKEGNQISFLPKHFYFPIDVPSVAKLNRYNGLLNAESSSTIMMNQISTKNSSFLKSAKSKIHQTNAKRQQQVQKNEKVEQIKKIKKFLSNTGNDLKSCKQIGEKIEEVPIEKLQHIQLQKKTSKSTEKYVKRRHMIKTQQIPVKKQQTIDKQLTKKSEDIQKTKGKPNPWRVTKKQTTTKELSQVLVPKTGDERSIETPETVSMFKGKNKLTSKFLQTKNHPFQSKCQNYSDSQYFQLSQKFSTLTDGKFFKNQLINMTRHHFQNQEKHGEQYQIQENIEMQANSMSSSVNKRQVDNDKAQQIHESMGGMNKVQSKMLNEKSEQLARSSLYGFGQKLMRNFMQEVERPYSPPLMQKQITEQQLSQNCHHGQKEQVQLIYDPVLNCYYDHRTHTYYQLKN